MVGKKHFKIYGNEIEYEFVLDRKINILKGDSGNGKTTLADLVRNAESVPNIIVESDIPVAVIDSSVSYQSVLKEREGYLIILDEDSLLLEVPDFYNVVFEYDIWFLIITREDSINPRLRYSTKSIYKIKVEGMKHYFEPYYNDTLINSYKHKSKILTEDKKSGYQFFKLVNENTLTAEGNSNIYRCSQINKPCTVIFDSSAFGEFYDSLYVLALEQEVDLIPIECFEYMLLKSSLFYQIEEVQAVLQEPSEYIETSQFDTWENYFENLFNRTCQKYHIQCGKALDKCFRMKCCPKYKICELYNENIENKVEDILKNNEIEYLSSH